MITGLALPYGRVALIADRGPGGEIQLFREMFDEHSWAELPERVPMTRTHNEEAPLGWAQIRSTPTGLMMQAELIDSTIASDSLSAMRAKLLLGLSIAFAEDSNRDEWRRGGKGQPPMVLRRGASLRHVALVSRGAYDAALVSSVDTDSWQHQESEAVMAPYKAERARAAAASRAESAKLMAETSRVCLDPGWPSIELREPQAAQQPGGAPTMPGAILPSTEGTVVTMGATRLTVAADEWAAPHLAERYREAVVSALRVKGAALSGAEMDEIRAAHSVLA